MDTKVKTALTYAVTHCNNPKLTDFIDVFFVKYCVLPIQRKWRVVNGPPRRIASCLCCYAE